MKAFIFLKELNTLNKHMMTDISLTIYGLPKEPAFLMPPAPLHGKIRHSNRVFEADLEWLPFIF